MHWQNKEDELLKKIHKSTNMTDQEIQEKFLPHRSVSAITQRYSGKFGINRKNRIPLNVDEKIDKFLKEFDKIEKIEKIEKVEIIDKINEVEIIDKDDKINEVEIIEKSEYDKKLEEAINMNNMSRFGYEVFNKENQPCFVDDTVSAFYMADGSYLGNYNQMLELEFPEEEEMLDL